MSHISDAERDNVMAVVAWLVEDTTRIFLMPVNWREAAMAVSFKGYKRAFELTPFP